MELAERSLTVLEAILLLLGQNHVTVFKSALVWPSAGVSGRYFVMQTFWEIVGLQVELAHTIHPVYLLGVGVFLENHFTRLSF